MAFSRKKSVVEWTHLSIGIFRWIGSLRLTQPSDYFHLLFFPGDAEVLLNMALSMSKEHRSQGWKCRSPLCSAYRLVGNSRAGGKYMAAELVMERRPRQKYANTRREEDLDAFGCTIYTCYRVDAKWSHKGFGAAYGGEAKTEGEMQVLSDSEAHVKSFCKYILRKLRWVWSQPTDKACQQMMPEKPMFVMDFNAVFTTAVKCNSYQWQKKKKTAYVDQKGL